MKRHAIFLDGIWNILGNNTNVWRLRSLCDPLAERQLVYYGQGVGTRFGEKARGGLAGYGLDNEIIDAYTWLAQAYNESDGIFVFGFSRGAYAARSLSELIAKRGVLRPGAPLWIEQLFTRYRRADDRTIRDLRAADAAPPANPEERWLLARTIVADIKIVGIRDTMGSVCHPLMTMKSRVQALPLPRHPPAKGKPARIPCRRPRRASRVVRANFLDGHHAERLARHVGQDPRPDRAALVRRGARERWRGLYQRCPRSSPAAVADGEGSATCPGVS